jgi:hypothetical protein
MIPVHFMRDGSVIVLPSTTKRPLPRGKSSQAPLITLLNL